jgi:hypothetical protein
MPNGSIITNAGASRPFAASNWSRTPAIVSSKVPVETSTLQFSGISGQRRRIKSSRCRARFGSASMKLKTASSIVPRARCCRNVSSAMIGDPISRFAYSPGPAKPSMNTIRPDVDPTIGNQAPR